MSASFILPGSLRIAFRWAVALGATGFVAGFLGPMALDPEAEPRQLYWPRVDRRAMNG